ncbi:DUF6326 family protein [Demequina sp. NBRC 110054]|uniref:DUF6326 family protein n=1 Tax=Demequina sp. NBRC 110054 TaxID=1570343 RepID=UPI00190E6521|nr:DUF6326 family protein [Demequina sp. NBRC 110054]
MTTDTTHDGATGASSASAASSTTAAPAKGDTRPFAFFGTRRVVSALWLFAILNYLYCDVLGTHDPEYMNDILDGTAPMEMSPGFLLGAGVLMTIPILAVLLTRIAPHGIARWYSIVAGSVMTLVQLATLFVGTATMYYWYFSVIEIATTAAIVYSAAVRWRADS